MKRLIVALIALSVQNMGAMDHPLATNNSANTGGSAAPYTAGAALAMDDVVDDATQTVFGQQCAAGNLTFEMYKAFLRWPLEDKKQFLRANRAHFESALILNDDAETPAFNALESVYVALSFMLLSTEDEDAKREATRNRLAFVIAHEQTLNTYLSIGEIADAANEIEQAIQCGVMLLEIAVEHQARSELEARLDRLQQHLNVLKPQRADGLSAKKRPSSRSFGPKLLIGVGITTALLIAYCTFGKSNSDKKK